MAAAESESRQITWTVTVQGSTAQAETIQPLIDQFASQLQAVGATCNTIQMMAMEATAVRADQMEAVVKLMRQQGLVAEQVERQRLLLMAQMGQGSWADVVAAAEQEVAAHRAQGDIPQALGTLFQLVEYALNAGDKEKAVAYFGQAEQLISTTPLHELMGQAGRRMPPEAQEQTRQHYQRQLERLRNWLF